MRIIQANKFYYPKGGAERYMLELSRDLEHRGHTVFPFAMAHPDNLPTPYASFFPRFVPTERLEVSVSALRTLTRLFFSREARDSMQELIEAECPDLLQVHSIYAQLSPSILIPAANAGIPIVMTVHDHHLVSPQYNRPVHGAGVDVQGKGIWAAAMTRYQKYSFVASLVQSAAFAFQQRIGFYKRLVDVFVCPSQYMAHQLLAHGFPQSKVRVIPFGAKIEQVMPTYHHQGYVLSFGRLSAEKGVSMVIELAKRLPEIPFKIAGTGPEEEALVAAARDCPNVDFVGHQTGTPLARLLAGAACVLIPSRVHENFPLAALEAMAAGKPVLASHAGGMPELVEDRRTGFLLPPLDASAWAEALLRLWHTPGMIEDMGRHGRARVEQHMRAENHLNAMCALYEELLGARRRAGAV